MDSTYSIWFSNMPYMADLLKFAQHGHAVIYCFDSAKNKKLLPRAAPGHFVGMQSHRTFYWIYIPSERKVVIKLAQ